MLNGVVKTKMRYSKAHQKGHGKVENIKEVSA
jgi:hypothetical protein